VRKVSDVGRHNVVDVLIGETRVSVITQAAAPAPGDTVHLQFRRDQTRLYADGWLVTDAEGSVT